MPQSQQQRNHVKKKKRYSIMYDIDKEAPYNGGGITKRFNLDIKKGLGDAHKLAQAVISGKIKLVPGSGQYNRVMSQFNQFDPTTQRLLKPFMQDPNKVKASNFESYNSNPMAAQKRLETKKIYDEGARQDKFGRGIDPDLRKAVANIDAVLGKLGKGGKYEKAGEEVATVNGDTDTEVRSYDVWTAGEIENRKKPISGDKKSKK
jgi:hypothetical protein